jgi:hypothetical protein
MGSHLLDRHTNTTAHSHYGQKPHLASQLIRDGKDLGHGSLETTRRYALPAEAGGDSQVGLQIGVWSAPVSRIS